MIAGSKVQTQPVKVTVTTDDFEIEGFMHVKPGGYQSRISDLLNIREQRYIAITDATYRKLSDPVGAARQARTMIVRLDTIKMVIPGNEDAVEAGAAATAGAYTTSIASPKL